MSIADEIKEARQYAALADLETAEQRIIELEDCIRALIEAAYAPIETRQGVVERALRTLAN